MTPALDLMEEHLWGKSLTVAVCRLARPARPATSTRATGA